MKSKEKGDVAVGRAIAHYLGNNQEVCLPIGDKKKYDFIVDSGDKLTKVQCKYTSVRSKCGKFQVPMRVMGGNQSYHTAQSYQEGDFDTLFVCTADMQCYVIPFESIKHCRTSVSLCEKYEQYKA